MGDLEEFIDLISGSGIYCTREMPRSKVPLMISPMVYAGVLETSVEPGFAGNFLYEDGLGNPWYGLSAETTLFFDIYSPYLKGGQVCQNTRDTVAELLLDSFRNHTVRNLTCGQCSYDPKSDCYRCRITLKLKECLMEDGNGEWYI